MSALAPWVNDVDVLDDRRLENLSLPTGVTLADLCKAATEELWRLSGAQYDARALTVRPHRLVSSCSCASPFALDGYGGYSTGIAWNTFGPGWGGCGCDIGSSFELRYPAAVTKVTVGGAELAENVDWVLRDRRLLVRIGTSWPCCQDLSRPDGEVGTWSIDYVLGTPPPVSGILAARELVIANALDLSNKPGKLPARTESVTRQGVSARMGQPSARTGTDRMKTGIPAVDRFLLAANPNGLRRAPQCASPDTLVGAQ